MQQDDQPGKQRVQPGANDRSSSDAMDTSTPDSDARAATYFPAVGEVCPRCQSEDYLPVRDAARRDMRQCASCGLIFGLDGSENGNL